MVSKNPSPKTPEEKKRKHVPALNIQKAKEQTFAENVRTRNSSEKSTHR